MSRFSLVSRPRLSHAVSKSFSLISAALLLSSLSSIGVAQEKPGIVAPGPLQAVQLKNTKDIKVFKDMKDMQGSQIKEATRFMVGAWGSSRSDKETGEEETSIIEFNRDGSYSSRVRNSKFPHMEKMKLAGGRYAVTAADKGGFTLELERIVGDPEEDKATASTKIVVTMINEKTLRAPDGALLNRIN